jgi:hypothetical protein
MSDGEAGVGECDAEGDGCGGVPREKRTRRGLLVSAVRSLQEGKMTDEYAPSEEILKVAEEGIRGMLNCVGGEMVSPDVMIDAALHILAAWVASSQAKSTTAEREADIEELDELLPLYIEYHRAAKWLPDPHRADN